MRDYLKTDGESRTEKKFKILSEKLKKCDNMIFMMNSAGENKATTRLRSGILLSDNLSQNLGTRWAFLLCLIRYGMQIFIITLFPTISSLSTENLSTFFETTVTKYVYIDKGKV